MDQDTLDLAATLRRRIGGGALTDAEDIAALVVSVWEEIDAGLSPVLGQRGVALLYKRSLYLTTHTHSWLASMHEGAQTAMSLEALKSGIAQQTSADAANGGLDLLMTFHGLLVSLIGPSLTERLLRSVLTPASSSSQAQDTSA